MIKISIYVVCLIFVACAPTINLVSINSGEIITDGISIFSEDGTFNANSAESFIPFHSSNAGYFSGNVMYDFQTALKHGAKKVHIIEEGHPDTLYGVLYFSNVPEIFGSHASKSYQIELDKQDLVDARAGVLSYTGRLLKNERGSLYKWILWFSRDPFYDYMKIANRKWTLGSSSSNSREAILEYVPEGESIENWTQLFTIQVLNNLPGSSKLSNLISGIRGNLEQCSDLDWKILKETSNEKYYYWWHNGCAQWPSQMELGRAYLIDSDIYLIHYARKNDKLDQESIDLWVEQLSRF